MKYYFKRIVNDKIKLGVIILIFAMMFFDLLIKLRYYPVGGTPIHPQFATFLAIIGGDYIFHGLLFWFLPIYMLILSAEDVLEDYGTGYVNILMASKGKKKYLKANLSKAFVVSFSVIFFALILNLILSNIILHGATYTTLGEAFIEEDKNSFIIKCLTHPLLTNLAFIIIASVLSGVIGMTGAALAFCFKSRKIVYPFSYILWFIPFCFDKSIMLSLQPFSEYEPSQFMPTYIITLAVHIAVAVFCYVKVNKYEKI